MATNNQPENKADEVRAFLKAFCATLDKEGFLLKTVHFDREEQTGEITNIRMTYEERVEQ